MFHQGGTDFLSGAFASPTGSKSPCLTATRFIIRAITGAGAVGKFAVDILLNKFLLDTTHLKS